MNQIYQAGRWIFILSFSFYVVLHFFFAKVGVDNFVPKFLPFPYFWEYLAGVGLLAFIISGIIGVYDRLAALSLVVYLLLIIVLIHGPQAANPMEMLNVFRVSNMIGGALMYAGAFARDKRLSFWGKA
ncbi:MAG: DoxX family membrane protein [Bacteroidia bacterium]|nr:DoxX family membrane protein [Bacteroidia bacterium]